MSEPRYTVEQLRAMPNKELFEHAVKALAEFSETIRQAQAASQGVSGPEGR